MNILAIVLTSAVTSSVINIIYLELNKRRERTVLMEEKLYSFIRFYLSCLKGIEEHIQTINLSKILKGNKGITDNEMKKTTQFYGSIVKKKEEYITKLYELLKTYPNLIRVKDKILVEKFVTYYITTTYSGNNFLPSDLGNSFRRYSEPKLNKTIHDLQKNLNS